MFDTGRSPYSWFSMGPLRTRCVESVLEFRDVRLVSSVFLFLKLQILNRGCCFSIGPSETWALSAVSLALQVLTGGSFRILSGDMGSSDSKAVIWGRRDS